MSGMSDYATQGYVLAEAFNEQFKKRQAAEKDLKELREHLETKQRETPDFQRVKAEALEEVKSNMDKTILSAAESLIKYAELVDEKDHEIVDLKERLQKTVDNFVSSERNVLELEGQLACKITTVDTLDAQIDRVREALTEGSDDFPALYKELCFELGVEPKEVEMGCPVHDNQVHGKEASELRKGLEKILKSGYGISSRTIQNLLDEVDARDSLAHEALERDLRTLSETNDFHKRAVLRLEVENRRLAKDLNDSEAKLASCQDELQTATNRINHLKKDIREAFRLYDDTRDVIALRGRITTSINVA